MASKDPYFMNAFCIDCGRPYGAENGFPDLVIPNDVWGKLMPDDGLLCPSCLCRRGHNAKIECEAVFTSGPFAGRVGNYTSTHPAKLEEALSEYWGERCADHDPDCLCCQAWGEYDLVRGMRAPSDANQGGPQ